MIMWNHLGLQDVLALACTCKKTSDCFRAERKGLARRSLRELKSYLPESLWTYARAIINIRHHRQHTSGAIPGSGLWPKMPSATQTEAYVAAACAALRSDHTAWVEDLRVRQLADLEILIDEVDYCTAAALRPVNRTLTLAEKTTETLKWQHDFLCFELACQVFFIDEPSARTLCQQTYERFHQACYKTISISPSELKKAVRFIGKEHVKLWEETTGRVTLQPYVEPQSPYMIVDLMSNEQLACGAKNVLVAVVGASNSGSAWPPGFKAVKSGNSIVVYSGGDHVELIAHRPMDEEESQYIYLLTSRGLRELVSLRRMGDEQRRGYIRENFFRHRPWMRCPPEIVKNPSSPTWEKFGPPLWREFERSVDNRVRSAIRSFREMPINK